MSGKEAIDLHDKDKMEEEFGRSYLRLGQTYTRFIDLNPEDALERSNLKFIRRFQFIEEKAKEEGHKIGEMTLEHMEELYQESKNAGL